MNAELIKKADLAIADLTSNGGMLNPTQNGIFIRILQDSPTMLNVCRFVTMPGPTMKINKIGFGTRIMRPAVSATPLSSGDRAKPTTSQVVLTTKELQATIYLPYEVLEDNIEGGSIAAARGSSGGGLMDTIVALAAEQASLDLEEWCLLGDTTSGDAYLAMHDGWLKVANAHVVDAAGATINKNIFKAGQKAMPDKYLRNKGALTQFISVDNETEYRDTYANRGTALGDAMLQGDNALRAYGSGVAGVPLMPNAKGLYCNPNNLIFGIQRQVFMEFDKDIESRQYKIVITTRCDSQIEEKDAVVTYTNIGS